MIFKTKIIKLTLSNNSLKIIQIYLHEFIVLKIIWEPNHLYLLQNLKSRKLKVYWIKDSKLQK
jgi:hypothetical protein